MTGEEAAGPPGPKAVRLLCFVSAGFVVTVGINKWRELEQKSVQQQRGIHQQQKILSPANSATKPIK
ncbi:hypothetical protein CCACVL1_16485 [Corchorus capsularis]|uniref:Uncharacterized protein n=1 Tax=Corchorus capsularis TaxID=210143 RepID=A0A1R3HWV3_COCAP|nr:hypothetical protein CCACVL1_16485 [Corchorus capsularis]